MSVHRRLALGVGLSLLAHALLLIFAGSTLPHSRKEILDQPKLIARLMPAPAQAVREHPHVPMSTDRLAKKTRLLLRVTKANLSSASPIVDPAPAENEPDQGGDNRLAAQEIPPMPANWTAEPPAEQYHVPQSPFGTTVKRSDDASLQYARPSYIDPAQNLAAQAAQTRAMQFQLLASQLGQLSGSWLRPNRNIEGKCRLGPESESVFSCAPSEMRDLVEAGERQLVSTLQAIRSLGMPATGVSISYRDGRYGVSLLGD